MPFVKIRLTDTGMDSFHGDIAGEKFENGISVEAMPLVMADRIAALMPAVVLDEDGQDTHQAGLSHRLIAASAVAAEPEPRVRVATEEEVIAERMRQAAMSGDKVTIYSEQQLEALAAADGIDGLREIAKPWGVKGREITRLIAMIVKAQREYLLAADKIEAEKIANRERAQAESIKAEADRRQSIVDEGKHWSPEIEKFETIEQRKARLSKPDETPNAIGPNGEAMFVAPKPTLVTNEDAPKPPADVVVEGAA